MLSKHVEKLKTLTSQSNANFSQCADYFLNHLGHDESLLDLGKVINNKLKMDYYLALLNPIATHYGNEIKITELLLIRVKKYRFIHGTVRLSNQLFGMLYFFEEIQIGMASVSQFGRENTDFFRLNYYVIPASGDPKDKIFLPTNTVLQ